MSNSSLKFPKKLRRTKQHSRQNIRKKGKFILEQAVLHIIFFCVNTLTFMLTCVKIQFKGSSRDIEQQVNTVNASVALI